MAFFRTLARWLSARPSRPASRRPILRVAGMRAQSRESPTKIHERLSEIASTTAPEDAFGPALQAIIDALGAEAAALCLFDPERGVLRLAAEIGLSDEACRDLRSVREGLPMGWDMPLHSLLNRRTYLIESAARNRYVPPLIKPASAIGVAACLPVVAGELSLGSLILVTRAPKSLDEKDLRGLQPAVRDLAELIVALRRRAPGSTSWRPPEAFRRSRSGSGS